MVEISICVAIKYRTHSKYKYKPSFFFYKQTMK